MRFPRLFTDATLVVGKDIRLPAEQSHYLRQVLRLQKGDHVLMFNGASAEYEAEIILLSKQTCDCRVLSSDTVGRELSVSVHVIQAACRNDKIETVLQKCTELGAASFQIVVSDRATLRLAPGKSGSRLSRWRKIIIEASEQSGRTRIPEISWRKSWSEIQSGGRCFVLNPEGNQFWTDVRPGVAKAKSVTLAVGPEGGWSERDLENWQGLGFEGLCFGPRILRTETAAPALLAAIQAVLD